MKSLYRELVLIAACSLLAFTPAFLGSASGALGAPLSLDKQMPAIMSTCELVLDNIAVRQEETERLCYSAPAAMSGLSAYDVQYHQIWDLVSRYFLYKERLGAWDSWHHRYDGTLNTAMDAERAIDAMLDSLSDEYTFFRNYQSTQERRCEDEERNVVSSRMLGGSIGYLHISTFNSKNCLAETKSALKKLSRAKALVLDLRENKGGSIDEAFRVFSCFVRKGKFVVMRGTVDGVTDREELCVDGAYAVSRKNGVESRFSREKGICVHRPLIVVVNERTKSAAEMLAGALRDERRALILGNKTFGKGIVQRVWEFDNGTSVKITSARFYLPQGDAIHGIGIVPDRVVTNSGAADSQLVAACSLLKRKLGEHVAMHVAPFKLRYLASRAFLHRS